MRVISNNIFFANKNSSLLWKYFMGYFLSVTEAFNWISILYEIFCLVFGLKKSFVLSFVKKEVVLLLLILVV
jgi:hypothetical protein